MKVVKIIGAILFLGLIGWAIVWWVQREQQRSEEAAPFNAKIADYIGEVKNNTSTEPYLKGKVLVVDTSAKVVEQELFAGLPEDLRAGKPEDVKTVVRVTWSEKNIGQNAAKEPLYRQDAEVVVVDLETKEALGEPYRILGKEPSETTKKKSTGSNRGPRPNDQVIKYIKELPRK